MRSVDNAAGHYNPDTLFLLRYPFYLLPRMYMDTILFQECPDRRGDVLILPAQEAGAILDDGHLAAQPPVELAELKRDIAAAEDRKMGGNFQQIEDRIGGEI